MVMTRILIIVSLFVQNRVHKYRKSRQFLKPAMKLCYIFLLLFVQEATAQQIAISKARKIYFSS